MCIYAYSCRHTCMCIHSCADIPTYSYVYIYINVYIYQGGHVPDLAVPDRNIKSCHNDPVSRATSMRSSMPAVVCQPCRASHAVPSLEIPMSVPMCSLPCCAS